MRNIRLKIQYDGSNYSGWQTQTERLGIQEVLETAIREITGENINLIASGRTDAKVHSLGQVANFRTQSSIPGEKFLKVINNRLPEDIRIIESAEVDFDFHSRFDAKKKRYRYRISNKEIANPIDRNYSYNVERPLDIEEMKASLKYFIGKHDFESFMGPRSVVSSTVRTIYSIELLEKDGFIEIVIEGNSFLRYMIRIIIGTLIFIGHGKIKKEDIENIILAKDRRKAGPTAPARGLFLEKVYYD